MTPLDPSVLRRRFPALSRTGEDGRPVIYADAPGGSQVPETVIDAIAGHLRSGISNTHGAFAASEETDALIAEARRAAADITGADPGEVVFGPNSTTLLLHLSRSFGRTLGPGDEVVVTKLDHDANVRPWVLAAEDAGATVRWVDIRDDDVTLDLDSFDAALTDRTRLVAFTLASNAVGTIPPAAELIRRVHAVGALAAVDGVHFAQHRALDLHGLDADILACSPYKFFGPHLGVLSVRRELLETWTPYKLRPAPNEAPERWETGTQNHEGLAGLIAAVDYLADVGRTYGDPSRDGSARRGRGRLRRDRRPRARTGRPLPARRGRHHRAFASGASPTKRRLDERTPTFAVRVGDQDPLKTATELARRGIYVWDGHYYAITVMERLGLLDSGGAVRIGFCHYHSADDVDRVLEALADLG